jgi:acyl carrier protein
VTETVSTGPAVASTADVKDTIFDIIVKETSIDRARLQPDATLKDLEIESLDVVQIIFAFEETFQIYVPYNDPDCNVDTVGGLVETVEALVRKKQQA